MQHMDHMLTLCANGSCRGMGVDAEGFSFRELILVFPLPAGLVGADDDIQHLVHGIEPDLRPAQGFLQVHIPAIQFTGTDSPHQLDGKS